MLCWKSGISALMLATLGLSAQAQGLSPQDKNVLALLEWGGSTASALYGLVQADLHRRVPGDRYEQLAREITYQIHAGQSASALVRAPMDLAGSALYTAALVDPEPFSRTAAWSAVMRPRNSVKPSASPSWTKQTPRPTRY
ncbi:hypothetical protein WJ968_04010 [Achromobacter xylosoxidans]